MKFLVCGGRDFGRKWDYVKQRWVVDYGEVRFGYRYLSKCVRLSKAETVTIIHGGARGADTLADRFVVWANRNENIKCFLKVSVYWADWNKHKKAAGPIRNREMIRENPDVVIAFPGGRGTNDMISVAEENNIRAIRVHYRS